jgi:hypothetical protein
MVIDRFPVEEGSILIFARAIGDPNPIYSDPQYAAGTELGTIIAPPTYVQVGAQFDPEYRLRPRGGEPWFGSGKNPSGTTSSAEDGNRGGGLHAEQHFRYHRPLRVRDVLSATTRPGRQWEKQGRSGRLFFTESITEYRDQANELVITARSIGVMTERPAVDEHRSS